MAASARRPDRRLMPRPLPLHLASAMLLWRSSRAALTSLPSGLPRWNAQAGAAAGRLPALAAEIARIGPDAVGAALDRELHRRADALLSGIEAYRRHPYRRPAPRVAVPWRHGAARLLDYGRTACRPAAPVVLVVPSLINRYDILDLRREHSFVRQLAASGLRPLVLDWGEPCASECAFTLADYITGPLAGAVAASVEVASGPIALVGYCMGGTLAVAAALRRPDAVACLALLATPWDFHAERASQATLLGALAEMLPLFLGDTEPVPVSLIQSLFVALDPFLAERKFIRFAGLDPAGEAARSFVALEDWINDGVPLARQVALDCARSWYRDNDPAQGRWRIAGMPVRPENLAAPALIVVPTRDRIVPPRSVEPLAAAIPGATVLRPPCGHIGMMASAAAPETVWRPIAQWLHARLG
jgi:polyhydroxyalkanoate synthase subunit PhaC